jgi:hypothetical protein
MSMFKIGDTVSRRHAVPPLHYEVFAVRGAHLWIGREGSASPAGAIVQAANFEKVAPLFELGTYRHKGDGGVAYEVVHLLDEGKRAVVIWANRLSGNLSVAIASDTESYTKVG